MTGEQEERLISAVESLAGSFKSIAATLELDYQRRYPKKVLDREPTLTYVPSEQEAIVEDQQGSEEERKGSVEDWLNLGPREREYVRANGDGTDKD